LIEGNKLRFEIKIDNRFCTYIFKIATCCATDSICLYIQLWVFHANLHMLRSLN